MAIKTIICLSFIVLNNFFANMSVKKNCASPTKSLTARHCYLVTAKSQKRKKRLYYPYTFFKPNFTSGLFWACFEVQTIFWVWARTCRPVHNFEITATIIRLQEHHQKESKVSCEVCNLITKNSIAKQHKLDDRMKH